MIGGLGTYFADAHNFIAGNTDGVFEPVAIPELKQGHIEADMCRIQLPVIGDFFEKTSKVLDVIHDQNYFELNNVRSELTLFSSRILSISVCA